MSKDTPTSSEDSLNDPLDALLAKALRPPVLSSDFDARFEAALARLPSHTERSATQGGERPAEGAALGLAKARARVRKRVDYAGYETWRTRRGLFKTLVAIAFAILLGPFAFFTLTSIGPPAGSLSARRPNTPVADEASPVYIGEQPGESLSASHQNAISAGGTRSAHIGGQGPRHPTDSASAKHQSALAATGQHSANGNRRRAGQPADGISAGLQLDLTSEKTFTTGIGERRSIPIGDISGSSIVMNTASFIRVKTEGPLLDVEVLKGEVLFDMHSDPARQLRVSLGRLSVIDTATVFAVQIAEEDELRVTVQEGQVRVSAPQVPEILLSENEQMIASDTGQLMSVRTRHLFADDIARQLSWRQGSLEFKCERISEVAHQLNRYSLTKIEVADPALGNKRIGGSFDLDPVTFAALISNVIANVQVDAVTNQDGTPVLIMRSRGPGREAASATVEPPCKEHN